MAKNFDYILQLAEQVEPDVVESVPRENVEHPQVPEMPQESLASEAITRKHLPAEKNFYPAILLLGGVTCL